MALDQHFVQHREETKIPKATQGRTKAPTDPTLLIPHSAATPAQHSPVGTPTPVQGLLSLLQRSPPSYSTARRQSQQTQNLLGRFYYVDWILEHSPCPRLDFTVAVPRGPHFGPFLVAFMAMKMLLPLPSDICMATGWHSDPRTGSCDASQRCHQDTAPTPGKANGFPLPGHIKLLPSGQLLKIKFFFPTPLLRISSRRCPRTAAPELPTPLW